MVSPRERQTYLSEMWSFNKQVGGRVRHTDPGTRLPGLKSDPDLPFTAHVASGYFTQCLCASISSTLKQRLIATPISQGASGIHWAHARKALRSMPGRGELLL